MNRTFNFKEDRLEIIPKFIEKDFVEFIQDYISLRINANQYDKDLTTFINGYQFYSDPLIETILQNSCEFISSKVDINLIPSYSMLNMLMNGDSYKSIITQSSEISAILYLGSSETTKESLIYFEDTSIHMNAGDLLIYDQRRINLHRNPIENIWLLQASLNFVDNDGPNKDNIYDRRPYLGFT